MTFIAKADLQLDHKALDFGCGAGEISAHAEALIGAEGLLITVESSEEMIKIM